MATKDFEAEVRRDKEQTEATKLWIEQRVRTIHERVSPHDVLRRFGVKLRHVADRAEQFSCPFHGKDNKPSARVHPESAKGPGGVWCFVCQKRWDCIGLWKQFTGFDGRFTALLREVEKAYGIIPPEGPRPKSAAEVRQEQEKAAVEEIGTLIGICERRLRYARPHFDLRGYLTLGSLLDQIYHGVDSRKIPLDEATKRLRKILDKIGEKERSVRCLDV